MRKLSVILGFFGVLGGCTGGEQPVGPGDYVKGGGKADSSVEAVFVDFEFEGLVETGSAFNPERVVEDQLLYTIGHLNGDRGVGRLDQLELSAIEVSDLDGGGQEIRYHARMPVAWGQRDSVPTTYDMVLPRDLSFSGKQAFSDAYGEDCVDFSAHDVAPGNMWYYYRPASFRCDLAEEDVVEITASVSLSSINTTGKYPEYHKVWEDGVLNVVAVFGKYEDGATSGSDAGISAYNTFLHSIQGELSPFGVTSAPADVPRNPGVDLPDVVFEAELAEGKRIVVNALLVDNVRTAGPSFDARYEELTTDADLIVYNGHAGLGANIRAMAQKGEWSAGQYSIVFMNGCDTYAYVDSALADAHAAVNPDDPNGTRYLDIVTNALPSFFHSMSGATMALVRGLMRFDEPRTYEQMFENIDAAEVVLVSGEQDNEFVPGFDEDDDEEGEIWSGIEERGTVARDQEVRFETPTLRPGRYVFDMTGTADADLYVRVGTAPTTELYDCRPFKSGSDEVCTVDLSTPAPIHVMVRGWAGSSDFDLLAGPE